MISEWKIRQEIYHRLNTEHSDDLSQFEVEMSNDIITNAVRYFTDSDIGWIYPAKSYAVGICYARWLSEHFGGEPIDYLSDEGLLYNNDPYFVPYTEDQATYEAILAQINGWEFNEDLGLVSDMKKYFVDEFMITEE